MKDERSKPEIIKSVRDGDKLVLDYPEYTKEQLQSCYAAFSVRASEINRAEGRQHYRIAKIAELNQIIVIAEKPDL